MNRRITTFAFSALCVALVTQCLPASADDCFAASGDVAIADCTRNINSGKFRGHGLAVYHSNRGYEYDAKGDHDRAIADYNEAIRLDPKYAEAYDNRGVAYSRKGNSDLAIADYDRAIRFDPKFAKAYDNRGVQYRDKGDYESAIADFTQAISLDPRNAKYQDRRCWARALAGRDLQGALADCNGALSLNSAHPDTLNSRGLVQLRLGGFDKAIEDYSAALAGNAMDADSLYGRGIARIKSGDTAGGEADVAAARAIDAKIATAHWWPER